MKWQFTFRKWARNKSCSGKMLKQMQHTNRLTFPFPLYCDISNVLWYFLTCSIILWWVSCCRTFFGVALTPITIGSRTAFPLLTTFISLSELLVIFTSSHDPIGSTWLKNETIQLFFFKKMIVFEIFQTYFTVSGEHEDIFSTWLMVQLDLLNVTITTEMLVQILIVTKFEM